MQIHSLIAQASGNRRLGVLLVLAVFACGSENGPGSNSPGGSSGSGGSLGSAGQSASGGTSGASGSGATLGTDGGDATAGTGGGAGAAPAPAKKRVAVGRSHACAVTADRKIACWGSLSFGSGDFPTDSGYDAVVAGEQSSCARRLTGELVCWGAQANAPPDPMSDVSTWSYACGIANADGTVKCWTDSGLAPPPGFPPAGPAKRVSVSASGACVVKTDNTIACTSRDTVSNWFNFGLPSGEFIDISVGTADACALSASGSALCWGGNANQQNEAVLGKSWRQALASANVVCTLDGSGKAQCFGDASNELSSSTAPALSFIEIAVGEYSACGIEADGKLTCWGRVMGGTRIPDNLRALLD